MNRIRFIVLSLVAVTLLSHRPTLAQEPEVPELPKPLAMRGSIEVKVDEKGNLVVTPKIFVPEERMGTRTVCKTVMDTVEQTYQVAVDGKTETRTRVASVPRQISEQVPYTYNVIAESPELREPLINPRVLYPYARYSSILEASQVQNSDAVLFVRTSANAILAAQLLEETNRRQFELTSITPQQIAFIIVLNETHDFSKTGQDELPSEQPHEPSIAPAREIKRTATPGVITSIVQNSENLTIHLKYPVIVGRTEARTRTVNVCDKKTGQINPVEQSYPVCVASQEEREMTIENPKLFTGVGMCFSNQIYDATTLKVSDLVWIVDTSDDLHKLDAMLHESDRLLGDVGSSRQHVHGYAIVTNEQYKYTTASNNRALQNAPAPPATPAPTPAPAPPAWPLPAEKSAWINSLPFTQKNLNGKAMVLWFFEEGCPKCRAQWKELNSLPLDYRGKPVVFVAVNSGNNPDAVAEYAKKNNVNLAIIADTDRQLEKLAGVGEISLDNIFQAVIMTSEGKLHPADANNLKAAAEEAMKLIR